MDTFDNRAFYVILWKIGGKNARRLFGSVEICKRENRRVKEASLR